MGPIRPFIGRILKRTEKPAPETSKPPEGPPSPKVDTYKPAQTPPPWAPPTSKQEDMGTLLGGENIFGKKVEKGSAKPSKPKTNNETKSPRDKSWDYAAGRNPDLKESIKAIRDYQAGKLSYKDDVYAEGQLVYEGFESIAKKQAPELFKAIEALRDYMAGKISYEKFEAAVQTWKKSKCFNDPLSIIASENLMPVLDKINRGEGPLGDRAGKAFIAMFGGGSKAPVPDPMKYGKPEKVTTEVASPPKAPEPTPKKTTPSAVPATETPKQYARYEVDRLDPFEKLADYTPPSAPDKGWPIFKTEDEFAKKAKTEAVSILKANGMETDVKISVTVEVYEDPKTHEKFGKIISVAFDPKKVLTDKDKAALKQVADTLSSNSKFKIKGSNLDFFDVGWEAAPAKRNVPAQKAYHSKRAYLSFDISPKKNP